MHIVKDYQLQEAKDDADYDYELLDESDLFSNNANAIPLKGAVQMPRIFYGSRFFNQSIPLLGGEAPLVQALNAGANSSFDEIYGGMSGINRSKNGGTVYKITDDSITIKDDDGNLEEHELYSNMPFNQKTGIYSRVLVGKGDRVEPGQLVTANNFTDDNGVMNMGMNARIAIVPFKGETMDDAIAVSESFARRMKSEQFKKVTKEIDENTEVDKKQFQSLFPKVYDPAVLENMSDEGVVQKGQIINPGDPLILATSPRSINSKGANLGKLGRSYSQSRKDASVKWEGDAPGEVVDVRKTKNGWKVIMKYAKSSKVGDKIVLRQGGKGTISKIIPDDQMPHTRDGEPMEVLLNHLSLVSRANAASAYEIMLGKAAKKLGRPIKVPGYLPKGQVWADYVQAVLDEAGVKETDELIDPNTNKPLEGEVTNGYGYLMKLHHTGSSKYSDRGTGSYTADEQPTKGGGELAKAKRLSGLETMALMSSGARNFIREGGTLRGAKNDSYWKHIRMGLAPPKVDTPFVFHKFRAMLQGAGMNTRDEGGGNLRLTPFTDKDLDDKEPIEIENGEIVNLNNMEPVAGGLFNPKITAFNRWGKITLDRPMPNPAYEEAARALLGLTKKDWDAVIRGEKKLDDVRK